MIYYYDVINKEIFNEDVSDFEMKYDWYYGHHIKIIKRMNDVRNVYAQFVLKI